MKFNIKSGLNYGSPWVMGYILPAQSETVQQRTVQENLPGQKFVLIFNSFLADTKFIAFKT